NLSSSEMFEIASDKGLRLRCGTTVLEIGPDRLGVVADHIELRSRKARLRIEDDAVKGKAQGVQAIADSLGLKADPASPAIPSEVQVDGRLILLSSPARAEDPVEDEVARPTSIDLVDDTGKPISNQRYVIHFADGSTQSGFLDADGHAEVAVDKDATISFP